MPEKRLLDWFKNLSKSDVALAGGKGASLGEMTRAGIPVPNGYVILSDSFEQFIEETDLDVELDSILDQVNHKEMQSIENASEEIKALIMNAKMPKDIEKEIKSKFKELSANFVAVRSSATSEDSSSAAWAGQLDSFLNTKENKLLENVKRCWASLFTPRAIFYRFEKGLHKTKISVAVVVQKMVESEISGIAFSVHPVTQDRNQLIIEAGLGLGEAIVSGQITPDSYVVEKSPRRIIDKNVSEQERGLFKVESGGSEWKQTPEKGPSQKLSDKQIMELSEIILRIEKHYGFPCDIEWAFEKGKFFIVQSRPITTLTDKSGDKEMPSAVESEKPKEDSVKKLKKKADEKSDFEWSKDFLKKTPLDVKEAKCALIVGDFLFKEYAARNVFGEAYSPMFIPYSKTILAQIIPMERIEGLERRNWVIFFKDRKRFFRALSDANKVQAKIMKMVLSYSAVSKLSDEKLSKYLSKLEALIRDWWIYGSIGEDKGLVVEEKIVPLLMKNHSLDPDSARDYAMTVTMPKEQSIFSKERTAFLLLCRVVLKDKKLFAALKNSSVFKKREYKKFVKQMRTYSKKYFYARTDFYYAKVLNDTNLSNLIIEHCTKAGLGKVEEELNHINDNYKQLLKNKKLLSKKFKLSKEEQKYIDYFSALQEWLDVRKLSMLKHIHYFFNAVAEVGRRKGFSYDEILLFSVDEVKALLAGKELDIDEIKSRDEGTVIVFKDEKLLRAFYKNEAKELREIIYSAKENSDLAGTVASKGKDGAGKFVGKVKIIFDPANEVLPEGDILVTSMTRPEFVPIMKKAKAIITDEGGIACHAAIVSRELGIPCVIGTKIATKILKDGMLVEVDTQKGTVKIVDGEIANKESGAETVKKELSKFKWEKWIQRPFQAFTGSIFEESTRKESFEKIGVFGVDEVPQLFQYGCWYSSPQVMEKFDAQIKNYIEKHSMSELSSNLTRFKEKNEKIIDELLKSDKDVEYKFRELFEILKQCCTYIWVTHGIEAYFSRKLNEEVPKYVKNDVEKFIGDASFPTKKNTSAILEDLMRSEASNKTIVERAGWVKVRDGFSDPFTEKEIEEMRKQLKPKNKAPKIRIPDELKPLFKEVQELVFFRTERTDVFYYLYFKARPILNEIAAKHSLPFKEMQYYRAKSLLEGRKEKYYPDVSFATAKNKSIFQEGPILEIEEKQSDKIRGTIAFKGKARGIVRIVKDTPDLPKVNEGDILVTQMTFPSFIPAMVKAKAFVTDEGGITCHAAIVAREMQKPCIIGTKNATKILHDGDLVEVDADRGVVTILNSKKKVLSEANSPEHWTDSFRWKYEAWPFFTSVYTKLALSIESKYFVVWSDFLNKFSDGQLEAYLPKKTLLDKGLLEINELIEGNASFEKEINKVLAEANDAINLCSKIKTEGKVSNLDSWWPTVETALGHMSGILFGFDFSLNEWMKDLAKNDEKLFNSLSVHIKETRPSFISEANKELLFLVKKYPNDFDKVYFEFMKKYSWFQNSYYGKFNITKEWLRKHYEQIKSGETEKHALGNAVSPKGYELLARVASEAVSFRDDKKKLFLIAVELMSDWLEGVCKKNDWSFDEMKWLSIDEVVLATKGNKELVGYAKKCSQENKRIGMMIPSGYFDVSEDFFSEVQKIFLGAGSVSEIKGMSANKGVIRGVARVILDAKRDGHRISAGEILVTSMTRPEFLPLMNKAAAFVTDEGGVTCHAAIVAREMNKPCIISTKIGTQIIRDGSLIEVDGDKGIVRILSSQNSLAEKNDFWLVTDSEKEEFLSKVKSRKWVYWLDRPYPPFMSSLMYGGVERVYHERVGLDTPGFGYNASLYQYPGIYYAQELADKNMEALKEYFKTHTIFDLSALNQKMRKYNTAELKKLMASNLSPIEKLKGLRELLRNHYPFLWIIIPLEKYYKEKARKLTAGLIKESLDSWIAKVSIPKKKSAYVRMQDALSSGVPLEKVVKEFGWLKSRDGFTDFYTAAELEEIKRNYKEPKLIEEKVPEELKELVEELKELNFFRTDRTDKNYEFLGEARPILEEAAKTIGVTFKELAFFDANSVIEGKPNRIGVPFCYLYVNGRQVLQKEPFFDFGKDKSKEVKGVVAYKGLVRGIVKIVRHPSEIEKVQKDDILVSQMTFPSFIAAMQKAAAFVTDEGSITCHAAIVAREMKKPCIIGTKNATKVLKDGDYVEVDANKGVVTILSKEKK